MFKKESKVKQYKFLISRKEMSDYLAAPKLEQKFYHRK